MLIKNGAMQIELKEDIGRLEQEIQELLKLRNIILKATNMQVLEGKTQLIGRKTEEIEIRSRKEHTMHMAEISKEIIDLVEQRKKAREEKNWQESDRIRDLIKEKGYEVKDTKEGVEINKI